MTLFACFNLFSAAATWPMANPIAPAASAQDRKLKATMGTQRPLLESREALDVAANPGSVPMPIPLNSPVANPVRILLWPRPKKLQRLRIPPAARTGTPSGATSRITLFINRKLPEVSPASRRLKAFLTDSFCIAFKADSFCIVLQRAGFPSKNQHRIPCSWMVLAMLSGMGLKPSQSFWYTTNMQKSALWDFLSDSSLY